MQSASDVSEQWQHLRAGLDRVIMGQETVKEQLLVCLLAGGHVLLEGVPGTAKTLLALTLSRLLGCRFRRIQFTPDLMPADILGTSIYNQKSQDFEFRAGPDLRRPPAGRRDQPHPAAHPGRAARSDAGARGDARRRAA